MPKRRQDFLFPREGRGFLGENNTDGLTDAIFASGALSSLRNYHLRGRGRLLKREGDTPYVDSTPNGSSPIQGLGVLLDDGTETLVAHSGGILSSLTGGVWVDRTGALAPSSGQDVLPRFCRWNDGTNGVLVWTDDVSNPAYWDGNAASFSALAIARARDVESFKDHVFAINTPDRPTAIRYSDYQDITSFPSESIFDCDRDSVGMGLMRHNEETLLAFYETSVHKINFNYGGAGALSSFFVNQPIDMSNGLKAKSSLISYKGVTYFASDDGFYAVRRTDAPASYISRSQENFWSGLNQSRIKHIVGFTRGEPFNEVGWLVSYGTSTTHNYVMLFNPVIARLYGDDAGWAIFESGDNLINFNAATNFTDALGQQKTLVGKYDGSVHHAWGHDNDSAGYLDNAAGPILSTIQTGFLNLGYRGMKGHRELWIDMDLPSSRTFSLVVDGTNQQLGGDISVSAGANADELDTTFILDESFLAGSGVTDAPMKVEGNSRWFRYKLTEQGSEQPHTINALTMLYKSKGMRIR